MYLACYLPRDGPHGIVIVSDFSILYCSSNASPKPSCRFLDWPLDGGPCMGGLCWKMPYVWALGRDQPLHLHLQPRADYHPLPRASPVETDPRSSGGSAEGSPQQFIFRMRLCFKKLDACSQACLARHGAPAVEVLQVVGGATRCFRHLGLVLHVLNQGGSSSASITEATETLERHIPSTKPQ